MYDRNDDMHDQMMEEGRDAAESDKHRWDAELDAEEAAEIAKAAEVQAEYEAEIAAQEDVDGGDVTMDKHAQLRQVLESYGNPEYGDAIIDEICELFDYPVTNQ